MRARDLPQLPHDLCRRGSPAMAQVLLNKLGQHFTSCFGTAFRQLPCPQPQLSHWIRTQRGDERRRRVAPGCVAAGRGLAVQGPQDGGRGQVPSSSSRTRGWDLLSAGHGDPRKPLLLPKPRRLGPQYRHHPRPGRISGQGLQPRPLLRAGSGVRGFGALCGGRGGGLRGGLARSPTRVASGSSGTSPRPAAGDHGGAPTPGAPRPPGPAAPLTCRRPPPAPPCPVPPRPPASASSRSTSTSALGAMSRFRPPPPHVTAQRPSPAPLEAPRGSLKGAAALQRGSGSREGMTSAPAEPGGGVSAPPQRAAPAPHP